MAKCDVFKRSRNIIRDSYGFINPYKVVSGIIKCLSYVFLGKQNVVSLRKVSIVWRRHSFYSVSYMFRKCIDYVSLCSYCVQG